MTMAWFRGVWASGLLLLFLPILTGCEKSKASDSKKAALPVKVETGSPVEQAVTDFYDFTGRLEAAESVEIRARVSGYLTKIAFDPGIEHGAEVKTGDLLFEIDLRPYQNALAGAEAQLAQAQAVLKTTELQLVRTEELFKKNIATQQDLDTDTGNKLRTAAAVLVAQAAVEQAKLDLEFAEIKAPLSGRISRSVPSVGDLITPSGGQLTSIVSVDPIHLYFDMDESTLQRLQKIVREGKLKGPTEVEIPLLLGLATDEGYPYRGKLDFVENQVDPNTGTIRVRGVFSNPKSERGPRPLSPGFFGRVRLQLGEPHKAVLISERAIGRDQGQSFVYVVNSENEVVYRRVKLGALHDGLRVIEDGLTASDRIVTNGLQRVRPGSKVEEIGRGG